MDSFNENVIEFMRGDKTATITVVGNSRWSTKIHKLAKKFPDEVSILHENADGSLMAHIPVKYIKINNIKRELSEEQRERARKRLQTWHENNQEK